MDGHEHCHTYPTVNRIVLLKAAELGIPVRSIRPIARPIGLKERVLARLGTHGHKLAQELGVETNWGFSGILPLDDPERAIAVLGSQIEAANRAAQSSGEDIWVMVHPGDEHDPVQIQGHSAKLRSLETEYLLSRV
ncbi:ChbG/HpnK family deacetylase [Marivivens sp. LCG002]|uniref:ChbG/HpnK family deacetylase n=1 Tax=Marivivens sp. LCG002 TaxID=3051171 RepID=UPI00332027A6